jgi:hypothetical protein
LSLWAILKYLITKSNTSLYFKPNHPASQENKYDTIVLQYQQGTLFQAYNRSGITLLQQIL